MGRVRIGGVRNVVALAAVALLLPAAAAAAAPRVFVAASPGSTIAFAVQDGRASVLGLDTVAYCSYLEPTEHLRPRPASPFAVAPLPMRTGPAGLTAHLAETEMRAGALSWDIAASFSGEKLVGEFSYTATEGTFSQCQSGNYYLDGPAAVAFEAVPYAPSGDPSAAPPAPAEVPNYYAHQARFEAFIQARGNAVKVRGALESPCRFGGRHESRRSPLFGGPSFFAVDGQGHFERRFEKSGRPSGGAPVEEVTRIAGTVGEGGITGSYRRTLIARPAKGPARRCGTGLLRFRAPRYLPPAGT